MLGGGEGVGTIRVLNSVGRRRGDGNNQSFV